MALRGYGGTDEKCSECGRIVPQGNTNKDGWCRPCVEAFKSDGKAWKRVNRKIGRTNDLD